MILDTPTNSSRVQTLHSILSFVAATTKDTESASNERRELFSAPDTFKKLLDGREDTIASILSVLNKLYTQSLSSSSSTSSADSTNSVPTIQDYYQQLTIDTTSSVDHEIQKLKAQYNALESPNVISTPCKTQPTKISKRKNTRPKSTVVAITDRPKWNYSTEVTIKKRAPKKVMSVKRKPTRTTPERVKTGLCLSSLWDPFFRKQVEKSTLVARPPVSSAPSVSAKSEVESVYNICKWIRSKGIVLSFSPPKDTAVSEFLADAAQHFRDGVILC